MRNAINFNALRFGFGDRRSGDERRCCFERRFNPNRIPDRRCGLERRDCLERRLPEDRRVSLDRRC